MQKAGGRSWFMVIEAGMEAIGWMLEAGKDGLIIWFLSSI
jgi:hypothetical protein